MPQWLQARGSVLPPPPPPPPDDIPSVEPDYEVIEFPGQQTYSNTIHRNLVDGKPKSDGKRCDLCGSSAPAVRCTQCNQQTFCVSCDEMYHRHPKRQAHIRKELVDGAGVGRQLNRPPLPPKGESTPAPVPPPRRNKRFIAQRTAPLDQAEASKVGFVGSLKRMMNARPLPLLPFSQDRQIAVPHSPMNFQEHINPLHVSRENGMSEWDMIKGHRSGSFSALNGPGFSPMMQAHSMAQLNCPSCHHGVMWNEWGHGNSPMGPWGGMPPPGAWHSSTWLNQSTLRREANHGSSRRSSFRGRQRDSGSSCSDEGDRLSTRGSRRRNVISPALSRRSRPTVQSDFESEDEEEEEEERRTWRSPTKSTPHNVSPVDNRRMSRRASLTEGINRNYRHEDDDILPSHDGRRFSSTLTRRGQRIFAENHKSGRRNDFETMSNQSGRRFQLNEERYRKNELEESNSAKGESFQDELSSRNSQRAASDFEDSLSLSGRKKSEVNGLQSRKENIDSSAYKKKSKRHERFADTGRRRSSPINNRYEYRGDPSSDSVEEHSLKEIHIKKESIIGNEERLNEGGDNLEEGELGPIPETEWDCEHCTFVNEPGTRVCAVCCKTTLRPKSNKAKEVLKVQPKAINSDEFNLVQQVDKMTVKEPPVKEPTNSSINKKKIRGPEEIREPIRNLSSKGTSPPPQSISTQTYDVTGHKLKRATSLAEYDWKTPQRSHSRQSLLSDTQSLPVTPPKGRSPDRFSQSDVASNPISQPPPPQRKSSEQIGLTSQRNPRRAGSQAPDYISTLVQKQVTQGLEMVKLLRDAEENQFTADDLAVALTHCEDEDPILWLQQNWRNMIDTVVTLATNYGHERKENTVGTISASEARDALRLHDGNVWAAVTECVDQRQRKYAELLSRGNFSREDIVTMLTSHHGNVEAAYTELNKSQLKPFLMRIWGPPQTNDNDSADFTKLAHDNNEWMGRGGGKQFREVSSYNSDINNDRIHKWLENQIYKPNLSQSMMHLNLIGKLDSDDRISVNLKRRQSVASNSYKTGKNSDVHRYLQSYFEANDNSLQINNKCTSMVNLNKNIEMNLVDRNLIIDALKVSNFNVNKNKTDESVSELMDSLSNEDNASNVGRDFAIEPQHIINEYENLQISNNLVEQISNEEINSSSSQISSEPVSNEEFLNQIQALRETFQLREDEDIVDVDLEVEHELSSSESYESLASEDKDKEQTEFDEEDVFPYIKNLEDGQVIDESAEMCEQVNQSRGSINSQELEPSSKNQVTRLENSTETDINNSSKDEENVTEFRIKLPSKRTYSMEVEGSPRIEVKQSDNYTVHVNKVNVNAPSSNEVPYGSLDLPESEIDRNLTALKEEITLIINGNRSENLPTLVFRNEIITDNNNTSETLDYEISNNCEVVKNEVIEEAVLPKHTYHEESINKEINEFPIPVIGTDMSIASERKGDHLLDSLTASVPKSTSKASDSFDTVGEAYIEVKEDSSLKAVPKDFNEEVEEEPHEDVDKKLQETKLGSENFTEELEKVNTSASNGVEVLTCLTTKVEEVLTDTREDSKPRSENVINSEETITLLIKEDQISVENTVDPKSDTIITNVDPKLTFHEEILEKSVVSDDQHHEICKSGIVEISENSSINSPITVVYNKIINEDKSHLVSYASDGNSDKDISSLLTDSEKDVSSISEDLIVSTKETLKINGNEKENIKDNKILKTQYSEENTLNNSSELINLLKESLSKEDVVERIVSTLFQTVLRASVDLQSLNDPEQKLSLRKKKVSESSNCASESEENSDNVFYEAVESDKVKKENQREETLIDEYNSVRTKKNNQTSLQEQNNEGKKVQNIVKRNAQVKGIDKFDPVKEKLLGDKKEREREIRKVLAEGLVEAYDQAELAVLLMEMKFEEEQSIIAAKECTSLQEAITFLQQECSLCAGKYSLKQMVSMLECDHRCCFDCAKNYFTLQITERSINDCVCPFCKEPELGKLGEDQVLDYFSNLDIFLKAVVQEKIHELFQRKLRDRTLMQDPNFKWCVKCSSGYIANPRQTRLICPDCKTITCAKCGRPWEKEHEKMTCQEYSAWKEFNDPENQLARHLDENGVTCPKCNNRYVLAKGGCMHLTCPQCKYEFCSGCAKQFLMGSKCKVSDYCEKLGLHSHHPRNCLFYLRDKEPATLEKLLDENGVNYTRDENNVFTRCRIQLLKESADGSLTEAICGYPVEGQGLCRTHYIEHLVNVIRINKIDPASAMDLTEAQQELRRHGKTLPTRADGTSDRHYLDSCVKMVREEIPLE
ncbi:linear Ubiquitin E3 ligase isoform X3 [Rhodnius prolixus]